MLCGTRCYCPKRRAKNDLCGEENLSSHEVCYKGIEELADGDHHRDGHGHAAQD